MSRYRIKVTKKPYVSTIVKLYTPQYKLWGLFWISIYLTDYTEATLTDKYDVACDAIKAHNLKRICAKKKPSYIDVDNSMLEEK
jgi:hypothetical protein